MNSFHSFFEVLEPRQLMSVSAKTLVGPLAAGFSTTYGVYTNGTLSSSYTDTNKGIVTVGGLSDYELDTSESASGTTLIDKQYYHQGSKGFLVYKSFSDNPSGGSDTKITDVYNPPEVILPFSLTAKVTQTFSFGFKASIVQTPGGASSQTVTGAFSLELASEKTSPLKVPSGKYDVYTIYGSLRETENGQTEKGKSTSYYSPGVGLIETVTSTSGTVIELIHVKHPPKAASAIAITAAVMGSPFADGDSKSLWSEVGD